MSKPKVIVFGYDELLLKSLDVISQTNTDIAAVVFPSNRTDPRIQQIRNMVKGRGYFTMLQPPKKVISEFAKKIRSKKPDLIFVWSYTMILPAEIIEIPKLGAVNLHMGLLPEYRGVNGLRWALINGEKETGVTLHQMDSGIDTGAIISKVAFPIDDEDDILSLMIKSRAAGSGMLKNIWDQVTDGSAPTIQQDESKAVYYSAKMSAIETIDWTKSAKEINNLIRASAFPFPGVYTCWSNQNLTIREASVIKSDKKNDSAGEITAISPAGIDVATGLGKLLITKIEIGGEEISIFDLVESGLKPGDLFVDP